MSLSPAEQRRLFVFGHPSFDAWSPNQPPFVRVTEACEICAASCNATGVDGSMLWKLWKEG